VTTDRELNTLKVGDRVESKYAPDVPVRTGVLLAVHEMAYWLLEDGDDWPMTVAKTGMMGRAMKKEVVQVKPGDIVTYYFDEYTVLSAVEYEGQQWLQLADERRVISVSRDAVELKR